MDYPAKRLPSRLAQVNIGILADERVLVGLLLTMALVVRIGMAVVVPPWQGPDEPKHFEYARTLVDKRAELWTERRIPNLNDTSPELEGQIIASMARNHFWEYLGGTTPETLPKTFWDMWGWKSLRLDRPSLYYFLSAVVLVPFQSADLEQQLLVVRLFSVLCSTLTVLLTYYAVREVVPDDRFIPFASAAFVAALPMHAFIGGTANSDNLVTFFGALFALGLARSLCRGFTLGRWVLVVGALILALATKKTAVGLLPAVILTVVLWIASLRGRRLLFVAAGVGLGVGSVGLAIATDFAGLTNKVAAYALNESFQLDMLRSVPLDSPQTWSLVAGHLDWLFRSFWGIFGWFSVPLSSQLYQVLYGFCLALAIGFLVWLVFQLRVRGRGDVPPLPRLAVVLVFLSAAVSTVVLAVAERLAYNSAAEVPQGRYLFGVITPIALIFALGARLWLPRRLLGTWKPIAVILLLFVLLDAIAYGSYLIPYYSR